MHEYSIASALLQQVEIQAHRHGADEVLRIQVRIGERAGVDPTLLHTAWELVREGTICTQSRLDVHSVPVRWACPRCEHSPGVGGALFCERCGVPAQLVQGDELILDRIEMEVP
jgi:hydrogenase nickel incorporation protein HypA/HybF